MQTSRRANRAGRFTGFGGRSGWRRPLLVALGCLLLGALFSYPALAHLGALGSAGDWDQHLMYHYVPYQSVITYGEFPLWNPWACGGTPLLANPQVRFLSPFFLLHLALGPVVGLHLEIVLHYALMAGGGLMLGRVMRLDSTGCWALALVFLGSSAHALQLAAGHSWALCYAYLPWVLAFTLRTHTRQAARSELPSQALARPRPSGLGPSLMASAFLALMIYEGGVYPAPQAALIVLAIGAFLALRRRSSAPLLATAGIGLGAVGLAAPKLLPTLALMQQFPRKTEALESTSLRTFFEALFSRSQALGHALPQPASGPAWGFQEYGAYLGPAAALLILAALLFASRRALGAALLALGLLLLARGQFFPGSALPIGLWPALHTLPVFSSMHVPSRFLVPFGLAAAMLAGLGAQALGARFGRRGQLGAVVLVVLGALDAWSVGPPALWHLYDAPQGAAGAAGSFHQEWWGDTNLMMPLVLANRGALHCYESVYLHIAAQMPGEGYRGEAYLLEPDPLAEGAHPAPSRTLKTTRWAPNRLDFRLDAGEATLLVVNQNYHPGWVLSGAKGEVFPYHGLLAMKLAAGATTPSLHFRSLGLWLGCGLFLMTLLTFLGVWRSGWL